MVCSRSKCSDTLLLLVGRKIRNLGGKCSFGHQQRVKIECISFFKPCAEHVINNMLGRVKFGQRLFWAIKHNYILVFINFSCLDK